MALRAARAPRERAGIGLTLLPVLYQARRLRRPAAARRAAPLHRTASTALLDHRRSACATRRARASASRRTRCAPSRPQALRELLAGPARDRRERADPHPHRRAAAGGRRLPRLERPAAGARGCSTNAPVDARWCLVHATHLDARRAQPRSRPAARSPACARPPRPTSATACSPRPRTSAPAAPGASAPTATPASTRPRNCACSNTRQRLAQQRRNVLAGARAAARSPTGCGSARVRRRRAGERPADRRAWRSGQQADFVVLDGSGVLAGLAPAQALASHVFANQRPQRRCATCSVGRRAARRSDGAHALRARRGCAQLRRRAQRPAARGLITP